MVGGVAGGAGWAPPPRPPHPAALEGGWGWCMGV